MVPSLAEFQDIKDEGHIPGVPYLERGEEANHRGGISKVFPSVTVGLSTAGSTFKVTRHVVDSGQNLSSAGTNSTFGDRTPRYTVREK